MTNLACADLVELVPGYLDDDLPEQVVLSVARHAETCPGCACFIDQVIAVSRALSRLGEVRRVRDHG